ncbi:DUF167 domain-containing protein [Haliea sp. E17]|uniref:DUF167 domain-containing protein n=1 Tax=Haliea sp. E17 TaxID=3401576 RepID=UPI003AAEBD8E
MGASAKLKVKVVPGASSSGIAGWLDDRLKVRLSAPPEKGKANAALLRLLSRELGLQESALAIVSGGSSPNKVVAIEGLSPAEVRQALGGSAP